MYTRNKYIQLSIGTLFIGEIEALGSSLADCIEFASMFDNTC